MKIQPNDDVFHGVNPMEKFVSDLPTAQVMEGGAPQFDALIANFPALWVQTVTNESRLAIGRIATQIGVLAADKSSVGKIFAHVDPRDYAKMWSAVKNGGAPGLQLAALDMATDLMLGALETIGGGVPIVGWVINAGIGVWKAIDGYKQQAEADKKAKRGLPETAWAYDRDTDSDVANNAIGYTGTRDWTDIFMPPIDVDPAAGLKVESIAWSESAKWTLGGVEGRRFSPRGGLYQYGIGCAPGLGLAEGNYQYGLPDTRGLVQRLGQILPATSAVGVTAWGMLLDPGQRMYLIDGKRIKEYWLRFYDALGRAIFANDSIVPSYLFGQAFGWAAKTSVNQFDLIRPELYTARPGFEAFDPAAIPEEYHSGAGRFASFSEGGVYTGYYGIGGLIAYIIDTQLVPQQNYGLDLITMAYVSDASPAMRASKTLRDKLEIRRRDLLQNPARSLVDLTQVPDWTVSDRDFARALMQATDGITTPAVKPKLVLVGVPSEEEINAIKVLNVTSPAIPGFQARGTAAAPGTRDGTSAAVAAFAVLAFGGAAALALRGRKRR